MDERDLDELRAIALSVGRLIGRLEQEQQSQPPANPPALSSPGGLVFKDLGSGWGIYSKSYTGAIAKQGGDEVALFCNIAFTRAESSTRSTAARSPIVGKSATSSNTRSRPKKTAKKQCPKS